MPRLPFLLSLAALVTLLALPAAAHEYKLGELTIEHPWARATIGQTKNGAAYVTLDNAGEAADHLIAVETEAAARAELHTHTTVDGVMKMRPVERVEVAPGSPSVLKPGGMHVMLFDLEAPLVEGDSFPMTLVFEKAGRVEVEVRVEGIAEMDGGHENHDAGS